MTPIEDKKYKLKAEVESRHANDNRVVEEALQIFSQRRLRREERTVKSLIVPSEIDGENMEIHCDFI